MSKRLISFILAIIITVFILLIANKPNSSSVREVELESKNDSLAEQNKKLNDKLIVSNINRDYFRLEIKKELVKRKKTDSSNRVLKSDLGKIQNKYNKITNDSAYLLLVSLRDKDSKGLDISKYCLEERDSVKTLFSLLQGQDSIIESQSRIIKEDSLIIKTYKNDSIIDKEIIQNKDSIISNKDKVIETKNKEIKPLKTQNRLLKFIATLFGVIAIAK